MSATITINWLEKVSGGAAATLVGTSLPDFGNEIIQINDLAEFEKYQSLNWWRKFFEEAAIMKLIYTRKLPMENNV